MVHKYIYEIKNNSFLDSTSLHRFKFTKPSELDTEKCEINIYDKLQNLHFLNFDIYTDEKDLNITEETEYDIITLYLINKEYVKCLGDLNKIYYIHNYFLVNNFGADKLYFFLRDYIDITNVLPRVGLDDQDENILPNV